MQDPPESGQLLHDDVVDDEFLTTVLDTSAQNETIEAQSLVEDVADDLKPVCCTCKMPILSVMRVKAGL